MYIHVYPQRLTYNKIVQIWNIRNAMAAKIQTILKGERQKEEGSEITCAWEHMWIMQMWLRFSPKFTYKHYQERHLVKKETFSYSCVLKIYYRRKENLTNLCACHLRVGGGTDNFWGGGEEDAVAFVELFHRSNKQRWDPAFECLVSSAILLDGRHGRCHEKDQDAIQIHTSSPQWMHLLLTA